MSVVILHYSIGDSMNKVLIWCSNEMQNFVCIYHDDEKVFIEGIILFKTHFRFQRASS